MMPVRGPCAFALMSLGRRCDLRWLWPMSGPPGLTDSRRTDQALRRRHAPCRRLDLALQCYMVHALPEQRPQPLRCRTPLASEGAQVMTAPAEPAQPRADEAEISPATQTLEKDAIGLGRSTIFAMAGAAPGQTV